MWIMDQTKKTLVNTNTIGTIYMSQKATSWYIQAKTSTSDTNYVVLGVYNSFDDAQAVLRMISAGIVNSGNVVQMPLGGDVWK